MGASSLLARKLVSSSASGRENAGGGFFQRCLAKSRGSSPEAKSTWRDGIYGRIREVIPLQGTLRIQRICNLAEVSQAGFYRSLAAQDPDLEEMEFGLAIQSIAVEHRREYGYRRMTAELQQRGMLVNHKCVARLMRADSLLAIRPRAFAATTDSEHGFEVYFNLAGRMTLKGTNLLWVADLTLSACDKEFLYLALVLDGFSRKGVS